MVNVLHIFKITGISGSENHLLTLLPGLVKRGVKIGVVMLVEPGKPVNKFSEKLEEFGIDVFRVQIGFDISLPAFLRIRKIIISQKPDVVHTHLIHGDLYGILAAKSSGVKKIISSKHNDNEFRKRSLSRILNRYLNNQADKIIVISKALQRFYKKYEKGDPDKIEVIYYGLNKFTKSQQDRNLRKKLGYHERNIVFGIIARLNKQKGHTYLLNAFKEVSNRYKDARLLIVGDGELKKELQKKTRYLGLSDFVCFLGHREDIADIYNVFDVFIHPSLWEGFGLVFLEAMSFSLPVIATRVSAIPEIVNDRVTGILVPSKSDIELRKSMIWMIENPEKRTRMGQEGKNRIDLCFPVGKMVEKTLDIYKL
jgi:glycosyltransferase involved in cell wall biosynthesis